MILSIYFQYQYDGKLAKDTEKFGNVSCDPRDICTL